MPAILNGALHFCASLRQGPWRSAKGPEQDELALQPPAPDDGLVIVAKGTRCGVWPKIFHHHLRSFKTLRRRRALLSAVGVSLDGALTIECALRNVSARGGKITLLGAELPNRFYLINVKGQVAYDATTAWKRDGEAGLKWNNIISLSQIVEGRFSRLRKILMERVPW